MVSLDKKNEEGTDHELETMTNPTMPTEQKGDIVKPTNPRAVIASIIAIVILLIAAAAGVFFYFSSGVTIETSETTKVRVKKDDLDAFITAIKNSDAASLDSVLNDTPELIFYTPDYAMKVGEYTFSENEGMAILDYAALFGGTDVMQVLLDHGAEFDDKFTHRYCDSRYSMKEYFSVLMKRPKVEVVKFMAENGASPTFKKTGTHSNALFYLGQICCWDKELTSDELELARLLKEKGADPGASGLSSDDNPLEKFNYWCDYYGVDTGTTIYKDFVELLTPNETAE